MLVLDERILHSTMAAVIAFPNSRGILWDRTAISSTSLIKSGDVIPPLFISSESILSLLEELNTSDMTIERRATVEHKDILVAKEGNSPVHMRSIVGSHTSVLKLDGTFFEERKHTNVKCESSITIPISPRPPTDFSLSFEKDSTL